MSDEQTQTAPVSEEVAMPKLYVGSSSVASVETLTDGMVQVTLSDPQGVPPVLTFTAEQFEAVKSETPYEDSRISRRKWKLAVAKIIGILMENHMEMGDMAFVLPQVRDAISTYYQDAIAKKFGVKDEDAITLQMIDIVLKS